MKKLKLTVDALAVESFEVAGRDLDGRGTVRGNESDSTCIQRACECYKDSEFDLTCATCDRFVETCYSDCPTHYNCPTSIGYPGC